MSTKFLELFIVSITLEKETLNTNTKSLRFWEYLLMKRSYGKTILTQLPPRFPKA